MPFDYSKFRTPFFNIEIGDPQWSNVRQLPESLLRRVSKIDITEAFFCSENNGTTQMTIAFVEGFDDSSGQITDLIFDGKQGIKTLEKGDKKKQNTSPKFLFQERNLIKVTWGYLEDKENSRSYMGAVRLVAVNFSESTIPVTTVTCTSFRDVGDQLATKDGRPFGTKTTLSKDGDSLVVFEDLKTDDLIRKIATDIGATAIISTGLPSTTIDKHKQKSWVSGQSFEQLMTRLASASGCTYGLQHDPQTGKAVIIFIKNEDFERRLVLPDSNLLSWKTPGSILKSLSLTAEFGGLTGSSKKSIDDNGKIIGNEKDVDERLSTQYKSTTTGKPQETVSTNPLGTNPVPLAKGIDKLAKNGTVGTVENKPGKNKELLQNAADVERLKIARLVQVDFTTIGYPKLVPGMVEIKGIGIRYSGKYRILSVTHSIDSNGYTTKCTATSQWLSAGGVAPINSPKGQEDPMVEERVFEENKNSNTVNNLLNKFHGIKHTDKKD